MPVHVVNAQYILSLRLLGMPVSLSTVTGPASVPSTSSLIPHMNRQQKAADTEEGTVQIQEGEWWRQK